MIGHFGDIVWWINIILRNLSDLYGNTCEHSLENTQRLHECYQLQTILPYDCIIIIIT